MLKALALHEKDILRPGEKLSISLVSYDKGRAHECSRHFHEMYEFIIFKEVTGQFGSDIGTVDLKTGSVVFIPPMFPHDFNLSLDEKSWYIIQFPVGLMEKLGLEKMMDRFAQPGFADLNNEVSERLFYLCDWLNELDMSFANENSKIHSSNVASGVLSLILRIASDYIVENFVEEYASHRASFAPFLKEIGGQGARLNIPMPEAASLCGQSPSTFSRRFKSVFGLSFTDFMIHYRLQRASFDLSSTSLPITDIAFNLDFDSASYFSKQFKTHFGVTPRDYRLAAKQQQNQMSRDYMF